MKGNIDQELLEDIGAIEADGGTSHIVELPDICHRHVTKQKRVKP
jgi:hypothetical protein